MTEPTPDPTPTQAPPAPSGQQGAPAPQGFTQADVDRIVADRLARERAKYAGFDDLRAKADQFDQLQAAQQTDLEKAVARAVKDTEQRVKTETTTAFGQQLAKAQLAAAVAGKVADVDEHLEDIDTKKLIDANGQPDAAAIARVAERLMKLSPATPPSFDGGARTSAKSTDMNALIRRGAGLG